MKANELMIGDWVFIDHCSNRLEPCFGQVKGIDKNGEDVYTTDGMVDISLLKPIPLTEDRLLANGFNYERNIGYVYEDGEYEVVVDLWNYGYRILHDRDVVMNIHCFCDVFVHELQHALRHCDVDKEIIIKDD